MKSLKKLSSIALLMCAFVYPSSIAEAKDNVYTQSLGAETNLIAAENGELLLARRDDDARRWRDNRSRRNARRRIIQRQRIRQQIRRQNARRRIIRGRNLRPVYIRRQQIQQRRIWRRYDD